MRLFFQLLKKEWRGLGSGKKNLAGSILGGVTVLAIMAAFVYLFAALNGRFAALGVSGEVLTLFLCAIFAISLVFSLEKAAKTFFSEVDREIVRPLPLSPALVVLSKTAALFLYELIAVGTLALPIWIAYGVEMKLGAGYYAAALLCVFAEALGVTALSALLSPLFNAAKKFLLAHGPIFLVVSLLFVCALFFGYKYLLDLLIGLIRDKRLQFFFNATTVETIRKISGFLVVSSSLALFAAGENVWRIFVCIAVFALIGAGSFFLCKALYARVDGGNRPRAKARGNKRCSPVAALLFKEINELVRTPGYMFSYLSIALSLPALVYLTMGVLEEVVSQLLTSSFVAPFALLIVVLYSTVSNTFAGDAVSREGEKLAVVKTIPVSFRVQIGIKLLLSLAIAFLAILATAAILVCTGTLSLAEGGLLFLVAALSTAASVLSMLNNDLAGIDPERNTSASIVKSFLFSVILGGIACVMTAFLPQAGTVLGVFVLPAILSALYLGIVAARYCKTMERRIMRL